MTRGCGALGLLGNRPQFHLFLNLKRFNEFITQIMSTLKLEMSDTT